MRAVFLLSLLVFGCRVEFGPKAAPSADCASMGSPGGEVWIYTSMYPEVIDVLDAKIREKWPDLTPRWVQAGSEKVAQRLQAEWDAGGSKACLLMTSDPFWYVELADAGRLAPHFAPNVLHLDRAWVDPAGRWATARVSLMVLAANGKRLAPDARPTAFSELRDPAWKNRFSMGDPLASGTSFTTLAFLEATLGWDGIETLRKNGLVAAGGSAAVLSRVESGEREVGVLLLENLLVARRNGSPAEPIFPTDGAVAIPGPIALLEQCPNPRGASQIYDYILSAEGQKAIIRGDMYAALPEMDPPVGAPPLDEIPVRPWEPGFLERTVHRKAELKERFATLMAGG